MSDDDGGVRVEVEARPAWPTGVPIKSVELKDGLGGSAIGLEVPEPVRGVLHPSPPSRQRHRRDASSDELTVALRAPQLERPRSGQVWESVQDCQNVGGLALPTRQRRRLSHPGEVGMEVMSVEDTLSQLREAERRRDEAVTKMDEPLAGAGVYAVVKIEYDYGRDYGMIGNVRFGGVASWTQTAAHQATLGR